MKHSMKRRLQLHFVLLAVGALILLQSLIVGFSIGSSYQQMTRKADRIILLTITNPDSAEAKDARYFRVSYHLGSKTFETDLSHTSLVTQKAAMDYAKEVIDSKTDKGYVDHYRYLVHRTKDSICITFLSRSMAMEFFQNNAKTLILVSLAGIGVMTMILSAVSSVVTAPLVKNHQMQKEFITSASHELKTPLTVISADAQLLESEIGENEWLSDIMKQASHMTQMTHRLVYLARMEEQDGQLVKIDFPISDLAEGVAESYRAVARNCGKRYEVDIQKDLSYHGDEKAIRELMVVLLDNAFKYSTGDGKISVRLYAEGQGVRFAVENTVVQIDPNQLDCFTERFYRSDTSDRVKGFGIGLSIARVIAEAHKGKLMAELPEDHLIRISAILK